MMDGVTLHLPPPGWYEDPEAADLQRWWDGQRWSDTEFRAKPEDHELVKYVKSYSDLSPSSPTNYLAFSSLVCSIIELAAALVLLVTVWLARPTSSAIAFVTGFSVAAATIGFVSVWTMVTSSLAVANGRRTGMRKTHAIIGLCLASLASILSVLALILLAPTWSHATN